MNFITIIALVFRVIIKILCCCILLHFRFFSCFMKMKLGVLINYETFLLNEVDEMQAVISNNSPNSLLVENTEEHYPHARSSLHNHFNKL